MNRRVVAFVVSLLVAALHSSLYLRLEGRLEPLAMNLWYSMRGDLPGPQDIVVIALDEESYEWVGAPMDQPWPRALHAQLLERLAEAGARRVVFDVLFNDASSDPEADRRLAEALAKLPTVIGTDVMVRPGEHRVEKLIHIYEPFADAAEQVALVTNQADSGYVRRFYQRARDHLGYGLPTLAQAAVRARPYSDRLPSGRDFIWFYGPRGSIETFPYFEVLSAEDGLPDDLMKEYFRNKIVFVGLALRTELGPAQKDAFRTPASQALTFGVEIHATAAANLIDDFWIRRLPIRTEMTWLGLLGALGTLILFLMRPGWAGLTFVVLVLAWAAFAYAAFLGGVFVPGVLLVGIMLPIAYLGSVLYYYFHTYLVQRRTQRAFSMYLSPAMAKEAAQNPSALELGGKSVRATAVFTDIADFTSISESMTAEAVSEMLNAYFTEVMGVVMENDGTLIKFIGDAIFAIWGAPIDAEDHAARAVRTALQIQALVEQFNASARFPALVTRIGVHTGPMVVGNLGSVKRFDYTAIGDTVNLAARLEGLNKYFGTTLLFSGETRGEMEGKIPVHECHVGSVAVKGKERPVEIYAAFQDPIPGDVIRQWDAAVAEFRSRGWESAQQLFAEVRAREPRLHKAAELYCSEIARFQASPPPDGWDGSIRFLAK